MFLKLGSESFKNTIGWCKYWAIKMVLYGLVGVTFAGLVARAWEVVATILTAYSSGTITPGMIVLSVGVFILAVAILVVACETITRAFLMGIATLFSVFIGGFVVGQVLSACLISLSVIWNVVRSAPVSTGFCASLATFIEASAVAVFLSALGCQEKRVGSRVKELKLLFLTFFFFIVIYMLIGAYSYHYSIIHNPLDTHADGVSIPVHPVRAVALRESVTR